MISIHALREESDTTSKFALNVLKLFQSTLSVRRATCVCWYDLWMYRISIHALREESDLVLKLAPNCLSVFQSTLSVRRATLFILLWE